MVVAVLVEAEVDFRSGDVDVYVLGNLHEDRRPVVMVGLDAQPLELRDASEYY